MTRRQVVALTLLGLLFLVAVAVLTARALWGSGLDLNDLRG